MVDLERVTLVAGCCRPFSLCANSTGSNSERAKATRLLHTRRLSNREKKFSIWQTPSPRWPGEVCNDFFLEYFSPRFSDWRINKNTRAKDILPLRFSRFYETRFAIYSPTFQECTKEPVVFCRYKIWMSCTLAKLHKHMSVQ